MASVAYLFIAVFTWLCGYFLQKNSGYENGRKVHFPKWLNLIFGLPQINKHLDIWGTVVQLMSLCLLVGTIIIVWLVKDAGKTQTVLFQFFVTLLIISALGGNIVDKYLK